MSWPAPRHGGPVRAERPLDRWFARAAGGLLLLSSAGLGGALLGVGGVALGSVLGLAAALGLGRFLGRRESSRRRLLSAPLPERWRGFLEGRYDHYDRLPTDLRRRFENDLRIFLAEKRVTGIQVDVNDELRLLVGCSAVTLSLGWPEYEWDQLAEVLLYPVEFDRDYCFDQDGDADLAGEAHPWGTVILSVPALLESFEGDDSYHVGLHEFAHLLDVDHTSFDGIPVGLDPARTRAWLEIMERETARLRRGNSVLDPYGAEDPVEFLAVAIEAFFGDPLAVRQQHRELYDLLAAYFAQDPAAWDEARVEPPCASI